MKLWEACRIGNRDFIENLSNDSLLSNDLLENPVTMSVSTINRRFINNFYLLHAGTAVHSPCYCCAIRTHADCALFVAKRSKS